jgi:hypothetical protein
MNGTLRRRLARLERGDGSPTFGDVEPRDLRGAAELVGEVLGVDPPRAPVATLPSVLDRAVRRASDAELARLLERVREKADAAAREGSG